jgi:hypothetical protein
MHRILIAYRINNENYMLNKSDACTALTSSEIELVLLGLSLAKGK